MSRGHALVVAAVRTLSRDGVFQTLIEHAVHQHGPRTHGKPLEFVTGRIARRREGAEQVSGRGRITQMSTVVFRVAAEQILILRQVLRPFVVNVRGQQQSRRRHRYPRLRV